MVVLKAEKQARQQEIQLRQNQEADYLKTLEADKQRQAQKAEEEKISKEKEQAKQEKAAALVTAKDTAQQLLDEAAALGKGDYVIRVKMPSGLQLQHEFSSQALIKHVRALVLVQKEIRNNEFSLSGRFPTKVYLNENEDLVSAFGTNKSQILFIKLNSEEESSEEESSEDSSD